MRIISLVIILVGLFVPLAHAQSGLILKENPTDQDGIVTIGDIFDGANGLEAVVLGKRAGTALVLSTQDVQAKLSQIGALWINEKGVKRIIVRASLHNQSPTPLATSVSIGVPSPALAPLSAPVVKKGDVVAVSWENGAVSLEVEAIADQAGRVGDTIRLINPRSKKTISARLISDKRAIIGPHSF